MQIKKAFEESLFEMEKVAQALGIEPFDIYFLGGSACILGEYTSRATRDFDFIDLNYPATLGKVFSHLRDFDMLEYESTILSSTYMERAKKLTQFKYINVYILAIEDIIVSKIIRLQQKDLEDIDILIQKANKEMIRKIIQEVIDRTDLFSSKKEAFIKKLPLFRERYHV